MKLDGPLILNTNAYKSNRSLCRNFAVIFTQEENLKKKKMFKFLKVQKIVLSFRYKFD